MRQNVQILLLFACMGSLLVRAEEETMAERKQRIMRKYLRERLDITYSDEVVPGDTAETDDVLASEKFKEPEVDLERQEPGMAFPPPMRPPAPRTENRNWLLSDTENPTDPYAADPLSKKDSRDEAKKNDWTAWGTEQESSLYRNIQGEGRSSWGGSESFSQEQSDNYDSTGQRGIFNPRSSYGGDRQQGFQQEGQAFGSSGGALDQSSGSAYNSIFDQSRPQTLYPREVETQVNPVFNPETQPGVSGYTPYKSPFQSQREQRQEQWGGYTPYKSPFQTQREQRQQSWGGSSVPKQEYQRQDTFQQWKQKNPAQFNPMSDDAYIKETMPKVRR